MVIQVKERACQPRQRTRKKARRLKKRNERNHPLVFVVVAGDNPHHPQGAHHGGDCFQDNVKARSVCDVLTGEAGANERARQAGSVSGRPV